MFGFEVPGEHASLAIRSHQAVKSNNHHQNSLIQQAKIEVIALGGPDSEGQLVQETIKKMDQHDTCDKKIMWWTFQVNAS